MSQTPTTPGTETIRDVLHIGTKSYVPAIFIIDQYKEGNCPLSAVEAALVGAMQEWESIVLKRKEEDEWISVEDGLPGPWTECIVFCQGRYNQPEGVFTAKGIHRDSVDKLVRGLDAKNRLLLYITHWRKLPSPPKN